MAQGTTVTIEQAGVPASDGELRERVARMRGYLDDAGAQFSAPDAYAELKTLRAFIGERPELLAERREVLSMTGAIVSRSATLDFADGMEPLAELMTLQEGDTRPPKQRLLDRYAYAELAAGFANIPGNASAHALAADQYGEAAGLADTLPDYTEDQRAGIREKQAFELHEAGRYAEALALNRDVLARGERLFGRDGAKLTTVLTNIAQNLHAMGRKEEAGPFLVRVQGIAEAEGDIATVQDMLFQRGVLAYELGHPDEARAHMQDRIARLREANEPDLLQGAEDDYAELERRLAR